MPKYVSGKKIDYMSEQPIYMNWCSDCPCPYKNLECKICLRVGHVVTYYAVNVIGLDKTTEKNNRYRLKKFYQATTGLKDKFTKYNNVMVCGERHKSNAPFLWYA